MKMSSNSANITFQDLSCTNLKGCIMKPVADPGFPRRGGVNPKFRAKTYDLTQVLPKTA